MGMPGKESGQALLMFDGVCNMCGRIAGAIMRWDTGRKFMFTPLQSGKAKETLLEYGLKLEEVGSSS